MIVQILITAFYIYGNIRLKEICILNWFEQIKENSIAGSAFSARLGSSAVAFIPDRLSVVQWNSLQAPIATLIDKFKGLSINLYVTSNGVINISTSR